VRSVFDTNVIVSALLFKQGKPSRAFRRGLGRGQILLSAPTLEEIAEVLQRKKFDRYVPLEQRQEFLEGLVARAVFVDPIETFQICRDPKDDKFLDLAAC
jgi:putative PIN family toxin of toxin-antitoxin system